MFCLKGTKLDAAIQLSIGKNIFSKRNYEITVVHQIHIFPDKNYKKWSFEMLFHFLKYIFGIWDGGLANSLQDHVIQV